MSMRENERTTGLGSILQPGPIVWAIDPFCDRNDYEIQLNTADTIRRMYPESEIHPVYVLSEETFNDRGFSNFLRPALKPLALKSLRAFIKEANVELVRKPRVLVEEAASRAACARKLLRYAGRIGAAGLAVSATQRRGLARFLVGSFSEAIMSAHHLPVTVVGPVTTRPMGSPKVIVYPTDFSGDCFEAFPEIVSLAAKLGAELHLFHKTVHTLDPMVQSGVQMLGGGWVSVEVYFGGEPRDHSNEAKAWIDEASRSNVKARFISENFREPTSDAIVEYVRKLSGASPIVAMVSRAGQVASWLLGSVTRDVIRTCPAPVYVAARPL
ncbi:MAG: universal stress protein [Bdellovibrionota bacterium]